MTRGCDVAVVGGGYVGLWTALLCARAGRSVTVVSDRPWPLRTRDRSRGSDVLPSAANAGMVFPLWLDFDNVWERYGQGDAVAMCRASDAAVDHVRAFAELHGCPWRGVEHLLVATHPRQFAIWQVLLDSLAWAGEGAAFRRVAADESHERLGAPFGAGLAFGKCATVDPHALLEALRDACLEAGVELVHAHAGEVVAQDADVEVAWDAGRLAAGHAVLALGGRAAGSSALAPHLSAELTWIGVWEGVGGEAGPVPVDPACVSTLDEQMHYLRRLDDGALLVGGSGRGGRPRRLSAQVRDSLARLFPALVDRPPRRLYSGLIEVSEGLLPLVGSLHPRLHYASGLSGMGIAASRLVAGIVAERASEQPEELAALACVDELELEADRVDLA
ncbi:MAG TPA: FAD-dependent oxidoreductase [Solirubrobacteraceae bacterium]|nr:FAD-dependent oxidoreductase [Solirubrobacteraceae bacterium]